MNKIPKYDPCFYCFDLEVCGKDEKTASCKRHVDAENERIRAINAERNK